MEVKLDSLVAMRTTGLAIGAFYSLIMIALGIPFMQRKIGPNPIAGIRIPATLNDAGIWYEANAYGGRLMVQSGIITGIITLLYLVPSVATPLYFGVVTAAILLTSIVFLVKSMNFVRALTSERSDLPSEHPGGILRIGFIATGIAIVLMATLSAYAWGKIPAGKLIVTHWGPNGPDGFSDKLHGLIIYPFTAALGMSALMAVIGWAIARVPGIGKQKWIIQAAWIFELLVAAVAHIFVVVTALRH